MKRSVEEVEPAQRLQPKSGVIELSLDPRWPDIADAAPLEVMGLPEVADAQHPHRQLGGPLEVVADHDQDATARDKLGALVEHPPRIGLQMQKVGHEHAFEGAALER